MTIGSADNGNSVSGRRPQKPFYWPREGASVRTVANTRSLNTLDRSKRQQWPERVCPMLRKVR
jgi:hypothetical protein